MASSSAPRTVPTGTPAIAVVHHTRRPAFWENLVQALGPLLSEQLVVPERVARGQVALGQVAPAVSPGLVVSQVLLQPRQAP